MAKAALAWMGAKMERKKEKDAVSNVLPLAWTWIEWSPEGQTITFLPRSSPTAATSISNNYCQKAPATYHTHSCFLSHTHIKRTPRPTANQQGVVRCFFEIPTHSAADVSSLVI